MSACHTIKFIQLDADCWLWGVNQRIFILKGESPSFIFPIGGIQKKNRMTGVKAY